MVVAKEQSMKGQKAVLMGVLAGLLVFGLMVTGCSGGGDSGGETPGGGTPVGGGGGSGFTVTGIPSEYIGKYAAGMGYAGDNVIVAAADKPTVTDRDIIVPAVRISGTSVTLPLWLLSKDGTSITSYTGSTTTEFSIGVDSYTPFNTNVQTAAGIYFSSVTFTNGSATKAVSEGTPY
jgi:hypothetical protein